MLAFGTFFVVTLLAVHDGDTMSVTIANVPPVLGERIRVRLRGIDAPELASKNKCEAQKAIEAREFVTKLTLNKKIVLKEVWRDKFFRLLANVEVSGMNISEALLKAKLAVPYDGLKKPVVNWCHFPATRIMDNTMLH